MKLLRYNVAMSLDGFIAGPNGEYDWIPEDPGVDFEALFGEFDRFVMGRKTWETAKSLGSMNPAIGRKVLVVSKSLADADHPDIEIVHDRIAERVRQWKQEAEKDVWLFGGANLFRHLLDLGLVDRVEVAIIPILLGNGIRLVPEGRKRYLKLRHSSTLPNGIVRLDYSVFVG